MATLRHNLANLVSTPLSMAKLLFLKLLYPQNVYYSGLVRLSPNVVIDTDRHSKIRLGGHVSMHSRCRIVATCGGNLSIGNNTGFNVGCIVVSRKRIAIGKNVSFGPNVLVYDHDHVMDSNHGAKGSEYHLDAVEIGDNSWIGAGSIILRGARVGKNCVIAAGSIVKGFVPDNTTLVQKRVNTYKGSE